MPTPSLLSPWLFLSISLTLLVLTSCEYDYQTPFSNIYSKKLWNQNGPLSGPGSDACVSLKYLVYLQHLIDRPEISSIVEIGFGDWEIMQHILLEHKTYIGFEVVEQIRRPNTYNREFRIVKGLREVNESADLLIVRDVMMHWPTSEITYFIENILPRFRYALLTNDYSPQVAMRDITPGQYRALNLAALIKNQEFVMQIDYVGGAAKKRTILVTNPEKSP